MPLTATDEGVLMRHRHATLTGRLDRVRMRMVAIVGFILLGCETARLVSGTETEPVRLEVTPAAVTVQKDETIDFYAVGFGASGDTAEMTVTWSPTGGTMLSQSTIGRRHLGRYRAGQTCGSYSVIATGTPGGAAATAAISIVCP